MRCGSGAAYYPDLMVACGLACPRTTALRPPEVTALEASDPQSSGCV
ncbi:MAG: hypothetical protein ACYDH5_10010 [Acidimicrobiales bacterium]